MPARIDFADFIQPDPFLRVTAQQRPQQLRPRHPVRAQQFPINNQHNASSRVRPP